MPTRRQFGSGIGAVIAASASEVPWRSVRAEDGASMQPLRDRLAGIEARCGGRLGVGMIDTQSGRSAAYRGDERFPMCSTYKALGAAAVLAMVDQKRDWLDRRVHFGAEQVLSYSPGTQAHAGPDGMTLAAVCEAAVTLSDNTAGNLMLDSIGGPAGLTAFLRRIGDDVTRLDRTEPTLNEASPGDPRDTTSPLAMAMDLQNIILGGVLTPASRAVLTDWLLANRTGDARLRAGVPRGWRVGDKTGTGERGTSSDIGVLWPLGRNPVVVTAFITGSTVTTEAQSAALASVSGAVASALED